MSLYPVGLDIHDRLCLIIGGGKVAGRKIKGLLDCGARIVIVSPEICHAIVVWVEKGAVEWRNRGYQNDDLDGVFMIFAATDNKDVQQKVAREADKKGILLNIADIPMACSFQVPARIRRGGFLVTVSTGGCSPAFAAQTRRDLEKEYGQEYAVYVSLLGVIRDKIVGDGNTSESHKRLFEKLLQLNILELIKIDDWPTIEEKLATILPQDIDVALLIDKLKATLKNC